MNKKIKGLVTIVAMLCLTTILSTNEVNASSMPSYFYLTAEEIQAIYDKQEAGTQADPIYVARWEKVEGKWYAYNGNNDKLTSWARESTVWYYLDAQGVMKTGWVQV